MFFFGLLFISIPLSSVFSFTPSQSKNFTLRSRQNLKRQSNGAMSMIDIAGMYSEALIQHPVVTKGTTGFFLCGLADVIAQVKTYDTCKVDTNNNGKEKYSLDAVQESFDKINRLRLVRFASKGVFGTLIWATWYDFSDELLNPTNVLSVLASLGINEPSDIFQGIARTLMLVLTEQFVTCPIIYGFWEIPISTLLNGAPISRIPYEIKDKLGAMLIENAKVWTLVNMFIYNIPVTYRPAVANLGDIVWQSIVSDFAADCGNEEELETVMNVESVGILTNPGSKVPNQLFNEVEVNGGPEQEVIEKVR